MPDSKIDDYWLQAADLTIYEAAFWMQTGGDPRAHAYRCAYDTDSAYEDYFDERNVTEAIHDKCDVVITAIRARQINLSGETYQLNQEMDVHKTHILKDSWRKWCLEGKYPHIAELFNFKNGSAPLVTVKAEVDGGVAKEISATVKLQIQQEDEILRVIREALQLDPLALPDRPNGVSGSKSLARKMLGIPCALFQSEGVFRKAWERLRAKDLIKGGE